MISQEFPIFQPSRYITELVTKGIRHEGLDKKIVFNPKKVNMAYSFGSHYCFPEGEVIYNTKSDFNIKDPKDANDSSDDSKTPRVKVDQVEFISLSEFDTVPKYMKVNTLISTNGKVWGLVSH